MCVCESDGGWIAGCGKRKKKQKKHCFFYYCYLHLFPMPALSNGNSPPPTAPRISREALTHSVSQLVGAIMATAELHCLRDNAWLTWSTSEPDISLSLHHNTTTQTDMAGPPISRAGLADLLCARCNGGALSSNTPRIRRRHQNTNIKFCALL